MKTLKFIKTVALACILSTPLMALTPADVFPDNGDTLNVGKEQVVIRKGTIYGTIKNSQEFDRLRLEKFSPERNKEIQKTINDIRELIAPLKALDMFEMFDVSEWLQMQPGREGRILVGLLYLQQYPNEATKSVITQIHAIKENASPELLPIVNETLAIIETNHTETN